MTCSACASDVDGVEVSPIQQRAVLRDLRRALVDPEFDAVVLARATKNEQWMEGYESAVGCVDALIEHLTSHIEGLADAVPPVRSASTPAEGGERAAAARLRELAETCERVDVGDGVMETPLEAARQLGVDLRLILAALTRATAPADPAASGDLAALRQWLDEQITEATQQSYLADSWGEQERSAENIARRRTLRDVLDALATPAAPGAATKGGERCRDGDGCSAGACDGCACGLTAFAPCPHCRALAADDCVRCGHDHQGQREPNEECLVQTGLVDLCPCPGFVAATPRPADEGAAGTGGA